MTEDKLEEDEFGSRRSTEGLADSSSSNLTDADEDGCRCM